MGHPAVSDESMGSRLSSMISPAFLQSAAESERELQKTVVFEKREVWVERGNNLVKGGAEACKAAMMDDRWYTKAEDLLLLVG